MEKSVRYATRCILLDGNSVMVTKYKEGNKKSGYYEIPGGKIEDGETSIQAAIREMKEETGLDVYDLKYKGKMVVEYPNRIFDFDIFVTKNYIGLPEEQEENIPIWVKIDELLSKKNYFQIR